MRPKCVFERRKLVNSKRSVKPYRDESDTTKDIGFVILDGAGHGLADGLQGSDVNDAVDRVLKTTTYLKASNPGAF